ncbi:MAG: VOC family protein [Solirubrobacterales bacterium]
MSESHASIDPRTAMGCVRLRVGDLGLVRDCYERAIGLEALEASDASVVLGAAGRPLVELLAAPDAPPRAAGTTGLFHLALLVSDRARLGSALRRLSEADWGLTGSSDHLVSEALYTSDPEGNGIEIYRDRPREEWRVLNGELQMATLPLDLDPIAAEADGTGPMGPGTAMGHVHLNVADIVSSNAFYCGLLGFEPTVRTYPGALFAAAGGYHHHLGLNTWVGEGAPASPPGSLGLESFEVVVPDAAEVETIAGRLEAEGLGLERTGAGIRVADPSSNVVEIRAA